MDIARTPVREFVQALAADRPSPGAGAAAGVALALAAACAAKALRISARHEDDRELGDAARSAEDLAQAALGGAQQDCQDFPEVLKQGSEAAARRLQADTLRSLAACRDLRKLIDAHGRRVRSSLWGDVAAARVLLDAAEQLHAANLAEPDPSSDEIG